MRATDAVDLFRSAPPRGAFVLLLLLLPTACGGEGDGAPDEAPAPAEPQGPVFSLTVAGVGFATPESALHDPSADVYLVSNINGGPADRDDNGFISRVLPSGEIEELKWIDGDSPEVTLCLVGSVEAAVELFNAQAPRFVASLISYDEGAHDRFFASIDAPFVGNGFTRRVDGQYALDKPELGLSNWEHGRLFGRSGILSGDSAYSVRMRAIQDDPDLGR